MDSKRRLFVPAKFREELGDEFILMPFIDGCLFCYTQERYTPLEEQLRDITQNTDGRDTLRQLLNGVSECSVDNQGRVSLTKEQAEFAALEKNVIIFGAIDHVEIWDEDRFNKRVGGLKGIVPQIPEAKPITAEAVDRLGIKW